MKLKLFGIYNKNYERLEGTWISPTAGLAIRDNSQVLSRLSPHFQEDLDLVEYGEFSDDGRTFVASASPIKHDWNEWKNPEVDISDKTKKD